MQPLTFTLSGIFIIVLSEMTIFNLCFMVHVFICTLNTILLHLHWKQSSITPKQRSGNVYLIITLLFFTDPSQSHHRWKCIFWQAFQMTASFIKCNFHSLSLGSLSIAIATISITGGNTNWYFSLSITDFTSCEHISLPYIMTSTCMAIATGRTLCYGTIATTASQTM